MAKSNAHYYFPKPKQVMYWDSDNDMYIGGVAYQDKIICACCGGVEDIDEIIQFAPTSIKPIKVFDDWIDLSSDVIGDYDPNYDFMSLEVFRVVNTETPKT